MPYYLDRHGNFVIENYNFAKTFSNFLPGVSGEHGKPLWCFYVNRGQAICSFGVGDRNNMFLEFLPADQAYQRTPMLSFRTFFRLDDSRTYEPFQSIRSEKIKQKMVVTPHDLTLEDENYELGIRTETNCFTLPNENFPALMRTLTITNISDRHFSFEMIDGLPRLMPFGMNEYDCKSASHIREAWMVVRNLNENHVPLFQLKVRPIDAARVAKIAEGNFFLCFDGKNIIKPIVDRQLVFGANHHFSEPINFYDGFQFPEAQRTENRTPSALINYRFELEPNESRQISQMFGQAYSIDFLNDYVIPQATKTDYFKNRKAENREVVDRIQNYVRTETSSPEFDRYMGQTFLDNVLRGGLPITIGKRDKKSSPVFHCYSRKHGDLERDYNQFFIAPTFYSQGNGNYRDVNQNRRSDLFFNPELMANNILEMMNLIQLDGYNPLEIQSATYRLAGRHRKKFKPLTSPDFDSLFKKPFTPGFLYEQLMLKSSPENPLTDLFPKVMAISTKNVEAEHREGYWSDHWHYNLDLIDNFLAVYPDKRNWLFFELEEFTFYDDSFEVLPRSKRYGIRDDGEIRQLKFVEQNRKKSVLLAKRRREAHKVRSKTGLVYRTNLAVKMFNIALQKFCTLDPFGVGVEMEAGKPNWYDAINGLPALFGSSTSESLELVRWSKLLIDIFSTSEVKTIKLPEEIFELYKGLQSLISEKDNFRFWNRSNELKEKFRAETLIALSGKEQSIELRKLSEFLKSLSDRLEKALENAVDPENRVIYTYFKNIPNEIKRDADGSIEVKSFEQVPLPLFLEGAVHKMKITEDRELAREQFLSVKNSGLFDRKLSMYKVNDSLAEETIELGRCTNFTPGWLENGSIWMHMEYKYLLEILRSGLYEEFDRTMREILIPFQSSDRYGRSPLENSSFIVSSENPDETLHGRGFFARLSGSTAEMLQIWHTMFFGANPFRVDCDGNLELKFEPKIPGWLFTTEENQNLPAGSVMAHFLGEIPVIFHNPDRVDTWKLEVSEMIVHPDKRSFLPIDGSTAELVRQRKVKKIEILYKRDGS